MVSDSVNETLVISKELSIPSSVSYASWADGIDPINIADSKNVIMDFEAILESTLNSSSIGMPSLSNLARFLFTPGNKLICIGNPEFTYSAFKVHVLNLFPVFPAFEYQEGQYLNNTSRRFEYLFSQSGKYRYFIKDSELLSPPVSIKYCETLFPSDQHHYTSMEVSPIWSNRTGHIIAFEFQIEIILQSNRKEVSIPILWFPKIQWMSREQQVLRLLANEFDIPLSSPKPDWLVS